MSVLRTPTQFAFVQLLQRDFLEQKPYGDPLQTRASTACPSSEGYFSITACETDF